MALIGFLTDHSHLFSSFNKVSFWMDSSMVLQHPEEHFAKSLTCNSGKTLVLLGFEGSLAYTLELHCNVIKNSIRWVYFRLFPRKLLKGLHSNCTAHSTTVIQFMSYQTFKMIALGMCFSSWDMGRHPCAVGQKRSNKHQCLLRSWFYSKKWRKGICCFCSEQTL